MKHSNHQTTPDKPREAKAHADKERQGKETTQSKHEARHTQKEGSHSAAKSHASEGGHGHAGHSPIGVQKALHGASYPASKSDLIQTAKDNGADNETIQMLEDMPDGEYDTPAKVSKAVGKEM